MENSKKRLWQVFSCEFCEIFKNTFFTEHFLQNIQNIAEHTEPFLQNIQNITWEKHIRTIESKLAKNIGLLYRAKPLLQVKSLKSIYFAYIHSYLNYDNIAWGSTCRSKLKTIYFHQKHAVRIVFNQDKLTHSRPLLGAPHALNVYQINLCQHLNFMYKLNTNQVPSIFKAQISYKIFENLF